MIGISGLNTFCENAIAEINALIANSKTFFHTPGLGLWSNKNQNTGKSFRRYE